MQLNADSHYPFVCWSQMLDLLAYPDADDSNDDPDQKKFNAEHVLVRWPNVG